MSNASDAAQQGSRAVTSPPSLDVRRSTVSLLDDGATVASSLNITEPLGTILAQAAAINDGYEAHDLTFSSLMLALMYGGDRDARWLASYFTSQGVNTGYLLSKVRKTAEAVEAAVLRGRQGREDYLTSPLRRTDSARRALVHASELAEAQSARQVDTSHLIGAIIALTDYHEEDFGALRLDRVRWGGAFVQHMLAVVRDDASMRFWQRFHERRFPGHDLPKPPIAGSHRRPDYDADSYTRVDLLAIEDQVSALAYVIAAKQTHPPLAIGLFGEWGSGKTFLMKHLRRRIDDLASGARTQNASERTFLGHIAQIEFNAWHYQEGDLWASLVDHILRNLRFGENEAEALLAGRRTAFIKQLEAIEARQKEATERVDVANSRVSTALQRVTDLRTEEEECRQRLAGQLLSGRSLKALRASIKLDPEVSNQIDALSKQLKLSTVQGNAGDLADAMSETRRELGSVWAFLVPLIRGQDRWRRWLLLGGALLIPVAIAYGVNHLLGREDWVARLASIGSATAALLTGGAKWLRSQTQWVRQVRERVGSVSRAFDAEVEKELTQQKQEIVETLRTIEVVKEQRTQAEAERNEAKAQATAIKTQMNALDDEGLMRSFLDNRLGTGAYQQKLGTAALVRRDFERLSKQIVEVTERETSGTLKNDELIINRIVLYIDDLDRCDMSKVVPVLRAVHLLLAFEAFVVVVGVDSRWVARCLEKHHEDIFAEVEDSGAPRVTPLDYLEKVFQIPIWLSEIPPEKRVHMVQKLFRKTVEQREETTRPVQTSEMSGGTIDGSAEVPQRGNGQPAAANTEKLGAKLAEPRHLDERKHSFELNPSGLDITDGEYAFLGELALLLSPSPRAIKRFVNTYRLINISTHQSGDRDSDALPRDAEVRMLLLAILVGYPNLSAWLQAVLRDPKCDSAAALISEMEASRTKGTLGGDAIGRRTYEQWATLREWLRSHGDTWSSLPTARVQRWLDPVGRFTFNLMRSGPQQASSDLQL